MSVTEQVSQDCIDFYLSIKYLVFFFFTYFLLALISSRTEDYLPSVQTKTSQHYWLPMWMVPMTFAVDIHCPDRMNLSGDYLTSLSPTTISICRNSINFALAKLCTWDKIWYISSMKYTKACHYPFGIMTLMWTSEILLVLRANFIHLAPPV